MSGDEICQRCGTKFEVDGYCENGHARPRPAAQPQRSEKRSLVRIPIPTDKTQVYLHGYFDTVADAASGETDAAEREKIQFLEKHMADPCFEKGCQLAAEKERLKPMVEALEFYADPENYHAILIMPDRPGGAFADDFSTDHGHPDYDRPMPGKTARAALAKAKE
jgi:hypothetical protein